MGIKPDLKEQPNQRVNLIVGKEIIKKPQKIFLL